MKRTIIVLGVIVLIIGFAVWWIVSAGQQNEPTQQQSSLSEDTKTYTVAEVATHNTEADCWTIINDSVYDVTSYVKRHPGGDEILRACGQDATSLFTTRQTSDGQAVGSGTPHSSAASEQLAQLKIGTVAPSKEQ